MSLKWGRCTDRTGRVFRGSKPGTLCLETLWRWLVRTRTRFLHHFFLIDQNKMYLMRDSVRWCFIFVPVAFHNLFLRGWSKSYRKWQCFRKEKKRGPLPKDMSGDNFRTLLNRDGCVLIVYKSQSKLPSTVCLKCIKDVSQENSQLFPQLGKVLLNKCLT